MFFIILFIDRIIMEPIQFLYNSANITTVTVPSTTSQNQIMFNTAPVTYVSCVNQTQNALYNSTSTISPIGTLPTLYQYQTTFTINYIDNSNNTLGSIVFNQNYQQATSGPITTVSPLNTTVLSATGVFRNYVGSKVTQTFDNTTGQRVIAIVPCSCSRCC